MATRAALVTGASSGFGLLTAARLAANGYRVFGTSRRPPPNGTRSLEWLELDVRSGESVRTCVDRLSALTDRIDLLVNNAGRELASVIEETGLEDARDLFETNFWGVVRVTGAVLPFMRRQRSGRIINVSSLAGLMAVPGQGFYSASKFALEGYTETLRLEVSSFNIHVSLVEPGFFATNLHASIAPAAHGVPDYAGSGRMLESGIKDAIMHGDDPAKVADLIVRVSDSASPRLRYRVGNDAVWVPRLRAVLPDRLFQFGLRRRFNVPRA